MTVYWIADHLVVGVDAEVVLPAARAVVGVVVGLGRRADACTCPSSRSRRCRPGSRAAPRSGSPSRSASPSKIGKSWSARRPTTSAEGERGAGDRHPGRRGPAGPHQRADAARFGGHGHARSVSDSSLPRRLVLTDAASRSDGRLPPARPAPLRCAAQRSNAGLVLDDDAARASSSGRARTAPCRRACSVPVLVGVDADVVVMPGHRVLLHPELRHPERVQHVLGVDLEVGTACP